MHLAIGKGIKTCLEERPTDSWDLNTIENLWCKLEEMVHDKAPICKADLETAKWASWSCIMLPYFSHSWFPFFPSFSIFIMFLKVSLKSFSGMFVIFFPSKIKKFLQSSKSGDSLIFAGGCIAFRFLQWQHPNKTHANDKQWARTVWSQLWDKWNQWTTSSCKWFFCNYLLFVYLYI